MTGGSPITTRCLHPVAYASASAQKSRFCARNGQKRGFQTPKAHKNPDFVLGKPQNQGKTAHSDTKTAILCSKGQKMGVSKPKSAQKPRFCARRASQNSTERLSGARNSTERPGAAGNSHSKRDKTAWNEAQQPEAQRNATSTKRNRNATNTTHATQHNATQRNTRNVTEA